MRAPRILHIAQDEKFINGAYYLFEKAFPGQNTFVVVKPPADPPIRYLSGDLVNNAHFKINAKETVTRVSEMSDQYSLTVLHGLNKFNASVYSVSSRKDRFIGIVHGAEIFNSGLLENKLMGAKTKKLYRITDRNTLYDRLKEVYRKIKYRNHTYPNEIDLAQILYKVKVFGSLPGMSYEKYIDKKLYNPHVKNVPFTYYPIEYIMKDDSLRASGNHILLGNSASATNNHLEAFDLLKEIDLGNSSIIAPLSYGCPKYGNAIIKKGKELFGDRFTPLTSFMPIDEYNRVISSCGIVVMNHYRPQAMGNIIAALYMGAKVFLNDTDIYEYFSDLGCHIYLIEKDLADETNPLQLLDPEAVAHNREILKNVLGTASLVEGMHRAFGEIFDFHITNRTREAIL